MTERVDEKTPLMGCEIDKERNCIEFLIQRRERDDMGRYLSFRIEWMKNAKAIVLTIRETEWMEDEGLTRVCLNMWAPKPAHLVLEYRGRRFKKKEKEYFNKLLNLDLTWLVKGYKADFPTFPSHESTDLPSREERLNAFCDAEMKNLLIETN